KPGDQIIFTPRRVKVGASEREQPGGGHAHSSWIGVAENIRDRISSGVCFKPSAGRRRHRESALHMARIWGAVGADKRAESDNRSLCGNCAKHSGAENHEWSHHYLSKKILHVLQIVS